MVEANNSANIAEEEKKQTEQTVATSKSALFSLIEQQIQQFGGNGEEQKGLTAKTLQEQANDLMNTFTQLRAQTIVSQPISNDILGVWRDPVTGKKMFTTQKDMRPKPKHREMELVNPNKRPEVRDVVADSSGQAGQYYLDISETHGNGTSTYHEMWPNILECQVNVQDTSGMRLKEVQVSKWSEDDKNLSCIKMTNVRGQESN